MITWGITAAVIAILVVMMGWPGLFISAVLSAGVLIAFMDDGTGNTPLRRHRDKARMKYRRRRGYVDFVPVDYRPADLDPAAGATRRERASLRREYNAYREWPDGVDGLYWLEKRPGRPAIAYHAPTGESPYVSVAFTVDGPIQGLHGDGFVADAQWRFGQLMAGWGASQKLVSAIQTVTRVLPSDSAFHELWLEGEIDPAAPRELQQDYGRLLDQLSDASFVQRHYAVIRWDADARFMSIARRRGAGLDGIADLIREQTVSAERRLADSMFHRVRALSGPQLGAVLRHLQHPDWAIDRASDVNVDNCWLSSHDEWSHTEVVAESPDPLAPELLLAQSSWFHRTAEIPIDAIEVREIDGLWEAPMLTRMEEQIVRTISSHIHFVPAREAKIGARRDATLDRADIIAQEKKRRIVDDESELSLSAAVRRYDDLRQGSGHHGAAWKQFVTVSARDKEELAAVCSYIEEAADEAGINRLDWLDTLQSAASATTWPLARGMAPPKRTTANKATKALTATTPKEAMVS
ncbi:MAG: hypothetical protein ACR2P2_14850 [Nakamurella sp.]